VELNDERELQRRQKLSELTERVEKTDKFMRRPLRRGRSNTRLPSPLGIKPRLTSNARSRCSPVNGWVTYCPLEVLSYASIRDGGSAKLKLMGSPACNGTRIAACAPRG
jgi:hypothetical protein